jgi:hypothetical protein
MPHPCEKDANEGQLPQAREGKGYNAYAGKVNVLS